MSNIKEDLLSRIQLAVDEPTITFNHKDELVKLYREVKAAEVVTPEVVAKVNAVLI